MKLDDITTRQTLTMGNEVMPTVSINQGNLYLSYGGIDSRDGVLIDMSPYLNKWIHFYYSKRGNNAQIGINGVRYPSFTYTPALGSQRTFVFSGSLTGKFSSIHMQNAAKYVDGTQVGLGTYTVPSLPISGSGGSFMLFLGEPGHEYENTAYAASTTTLQLSSPPPTVTQEQIVFT
jgi:hypothetical protein